MFNIVFLSSRMFEESDSIKQNAVEDDCVGRVHHPHTLNLGK